MARSFFLDSIQVGDATVEGQALGYVNQASTVNGGTYNATGGPFADRSVTGLNAQRTLGINAPSVACGMWVKYAAVALTIFEGIETATTQFRAFHTATGTISIRSGAAGSILGTSAAVLTPGAWHFIEIECTVHNTTGAIQVWVDGTSVLTLTNVNTRGGTANAYVTAMLNGGNNVNVSYGSLYNIGESSGSATRLGPVKAYRLVATADGAFTAWTANTGTRWQAIDEAPTRDSDTTYISDNTPGDKNSIAITDTAAGMGTIFGLAHYYWARRDDAGPHTMRAFLRESGGTEQVEATETLTASYVGYPYIREFSPFTGGSTRWTTSEVDGLQLGVELVS